MNRFTRGDLIAAGKALDDLAAAMGPDAEPGRQPWRGLGNVNLNRFDRASAIPLLSAWVKSLEVLQQQTTAMTSLCGWKELSTIAQVGDASVAALAIPDANPDVVDSVLALAAEDVSHRSLARWAVLAEEAQAHDASIETICSRTVIEAEPDAVIRTAVDAEKLGISDATLETLPRLCDEAHALREMMNRAIEVIRSLLSVAGRDPAAPLDVKAEALAVGFLHIMGQLSPEDLRFRSTALAGDSIVEELTAAQALADEVSRPRQSGDDLTELRLLAHRLRSVHSQFDDDTTSRCPLHELLLLGKAITA